MFQQRQNRHRQPPIRGLLLTTTTAATALVLITGAGPAVATQDPGPGLAHVGHADSCVLQRVGTQYVRCDDNTGNGVPAPAWIPER